MAASSHSGAPVPELAIRRAGPADAEAIAPLFDAYRQFYGRMTDPGLALSFLTERLERDESVVFMALAADEPVGFVQLYRSFDSVEAGSVWIVHDLFVSPDARCAGAGRALMEAARRLAEETGACGLSLATAADNRIAQNLYENLGYERDHRFFHYFLAVMTGGRSGEN